MEVRPIIILFKMFHQINRLLSTRMFKRNVQQSHCHHALQDVPNQLQD